MTSVSLRAALAAFLLALWCGAGLFFASSVARAAFAVLPSRALAGALVGRLLPVIFWSGIIVALLALSLVVADRVIGGRMTRIASLMLVAIACGMAQFVIAPRIGALRARIGPSLDARAASDPLRRQFGQLHGVSVGLLGVALIASTVCIISLYCAGRPAAEVS